MEKSVEILLEHKADPDIKAANGHSPRSIAVSSGNCNCIEPENI